MESTGEFIVSVLVCNGIEMCEHSSQYSFCNDVVLLQFGGSGAARVLGWSASWTQTSS